MKKKDTATKAAKSKTVRTETVSPEGINVRNSSTVPDVTEANATDTTPVTEAAPTSTAAPAEPANGAPGVTEPAPEFAISSIHGDTAPGEPHGAFGEPVVAPAKKAKKERAAKAPKAAPIEKVPAVKVASEVKHAIAILKLASLETMPKTAPKKVLDAIAMPSEEAIAKLIADAK